MAGGLMQLVAYGAQDIYLTGNPQITFFKTVYRRHTNFSMEAIEHQFVGTQNFGSRLTAKFSRDGDLLTSMYVLVTLNSVDPGNTNFAWIRRIGHAILSNIELEIGGTKMDKQTGTWLDIWYELSRQGDHERGYAAMIGDVPELTTYNTEVKPEYTLFIPLQFWFNRHIGLSIPVIALQYHDVRLHIELSSKESVIIRDCNFDINNPSLSIKEISVLTNYVYLDTEERRRFAQVGHEYLIDQVQYNGTERVTDLVKDYILDYNHPTKEIIWAMKHGNYISGKSFLFYTHRDDWNEPDPEHTDQNTPLVQAAHKILSESISIETDPTSTVGGTWYEVLGQSSGTIGTINITNEMSVPVYVNPTSLSIGDYGITDKIYGDIVVKADGTIECNNVRSDLTIRDYSFPTEEMTDSRAVVCDPIVYQFHNYGILIDGTVNPIQYGQIKLNGHDRFDRREGLYLSNVQADQHHSNIPRDGICLYSFSQQPEQHQPSGTANLTRIDSTVLTLWFLDITLDTGLPEFNFINDDNRLFIFATNYNILRMLSGLGGLAYSTA